GSTRVFARWCASVPRSAGRCRGQADRRPERGALMDLRDGPEEAAFRAALRTWLEANVPSGLRGLRGWSDPAALALGRDWGTRVELVGDWFVVNGQKVWSSYAHIADRCILLGRSATTGEKHEGLTYLVVDMKSPGVEVRPLRQITGEAEFNEIFFTDVAVPKENLLGEIGGGWRVAMTTLSHERGTFGFALAGALDVAVHKLVALARERALTDALVRDRVAREWIELQALRYTNYRAL